MADLTPANQNPWYVLSTLKGEQTGEEVDWDLAAENVRLWNIWACQHLTEEERQALREQGAEVPDAGVWEEHAEEIETLYAAEIKARNDKGFSIPDSPGPEAPYGMSKIAFSHTVVWEKAIFASYASFVFATFTQAANFESATFTQAANFESATFTQAAYFESATFTQYAGFSSATFAQFASFHSATFTQDAIFDFATFAQFASFHSATFSGRGYFLGTKFGHPNKPAGEQALLDLTDTQFDKPASFRGAKFHNRFPEFRGTILPEQTLFPFEKHAWPQSYPLFDKDWKPEEHEAKRTALMRDAANSCAVLRNHVKKQGHPEAEHYFFRREMGFLRQVGPWWQRLPYVAFGVVSDYGHSIGRPLFWLGLLWLIAVPFYFGCSLQPLQCPVGQASDPILSLSKSFGFSGSNIFKFFGFQRTYFAEELEHIEKVRPWLNNLAAAQTVFGYILLFFLGLGLRQRFRLR